MLPPPGIEGSVPVLVPPGGGLGVTGRMGLGISVVSTGPCWQPVEPRVKAAPTKTILTRLEVFIVKKLFGEAAAYLAQAGCEQLPDI
jgi:hypothetical protein